MSYKNEHATEMYACKKKVCVIKKHVYKKLKLNNIINFNLKKYA